LRRIPDGSAFPSPSEKGKVLVVNFWATWCGPCRALEPAFDRVAIDFQQNHEYYSCRRLREDETLVPPYVKDVKPQTTVVFADGLDRLFAVNSSRRSSSSTAPEKIAYRTEGYGDEEPFQQSLTEQFAERLLHPPPV